jgi:indole-3-glycerol phosphate synthase
MALASKRRARLASLRQPLADIRIRGRDAPVVIPIRLSTQGFDVIAEVKRRAPGRHENGALTANDHGLPARLASAYADAGAAAVSVLTEPLAFGGGLTDLSAVIEELHTSGASVPVMRKDFLVHPYQVHEARAAGADGVLLIADMLSPSAVEPMADALEETGQWLLVEAFEDSQFDRALAIAQDASLRGLTALVGVNARDLRTLAVDPERFGRLSVKLPDDIPAVAESGLRSADHAAAAARLGYRLALVGTALVEQDNPGVLLSAMISQGRQAAGSK